MREMKDSGVEWIGDIPDSWDISTINSLYTLRNQKVSDRDYPPLSVTMKGIVPQLETAAKTDAHDDRKLVKKGDFAINSRSDRRGSCGISDYDGSVSLINTVLTPRGEMHPVYYNWLFHSSSFADEFYRWGHGIVDDLWTTRWQEMRNITIPVPEYAVQQKIAAHLDRKCTQIDALISNAQQQIEKLKAYKQSVITETVTKGLDPDVEMKDSGVEYLGKIPMNWGVISIGIAFSYVGGYAFKSELFCGETNNQVLRIGNIKNDNLILEGKQVFVKDDYAEQAKNCEVIADDILFSMTGTKGKKDYFYTLLVSPDNLKNRRLFINQRVGIFRKKFSNVNMRYYNYVLKEHSILNYIFLSETGTANQGNLGIENISRTKMYFPTLDEQQQIADYLDHKCSQIDKLIALKQQKIEKLQQYKKSLIYEYVTGKKEV